MPETPQPTGMVGHILRSITTWTMALAGGLGIAVPILAATYYEMKFGRPSSTSGIAIPFAFILGGLAAGLGAVVGKGIHGWVARTRWAGPADLRVVAILLTLVVTVPSVCAIREVRRMEAANTARVIRSSGDISRVEGNSQLAPTRSAAFLWVSSPHPDHPRGELRWNGRPVDVRIVDDRLLVAADGVPSTTIDISRFDYAREVYGVTAALSSDRLEWLALLVQLRATARRELLFIFNPQGTLVHEELLEPRRGRVPRVGLGTAGSADATQEIVLDRGVPVRYHVGAR